MPPISKDEDGILQYVRAKLTVLTLLLAKVEPALSSVSAIFIQTVTKKITNIYLTIFGTLTVHRIIN